MRRLESLHHRVLRAAVLVLPFVLHPTVALGDEPAPDRPVDAQAELLARGEVAYKNHCVRCHGEQGQGVEEFYPDALAGDATVGELTDLIVETMPEDDPQACVGDDASAVAAFIHKAFYSENSPARVTVPHARLARLTGTQLRQCLADLYSYADRQVGNVADHGLQGNYYDGSAPNDEGKVLQRVDTLIDFDFGHNGPGLGINPQNFCIRWRGALLADVTGSYELIVRSTCSFMCYFGADDRTFIDNHVQSGDQSEFRRSIVLTGGRVYPLRIDFIQRERKTEQPPARISLSWRAPHGTEQLVPARNLLTVDAPATFTLQAALPPDDRSYGYERGINVDRQWDESTTAAALEFADAAVADLWPQYQRQHRNDSDDNRARLRGFLAEVAERAFRGPLDDESRKLYVDAQVDATDDDAEAIRRSLLISLKSPRFLYPALGETDNPSRRAARRLALTMFDSLPGDGWLIKLAANKGLDEEDQVRAAARRMVYDYRARAKTREFLYGWLYIDGDKELSKDEEQYADFDEPLVSDLRVSLDRQLDEIVWSDASDYRQFFLADWAYTTDLLNAFYGASWAPADADGTGLQRSVSDPEHRHGVLTHPYLMSRLAHHDATSPIHRGVFLTRYVLGRTLRPPQAAFAPLAPDLHPDLTTRQRVELQTGEESCQVCHGKINSLGFTLENYDAVGRYRETEREQTIDATGGYTTRADDRVTFADAGELAQYLATSDDAQRAFVNRAFQHFTKQPPAAYGAETLDRLTSAFQQHECNIRELLVEIAVTVATYTAPIARDSGDAAPANEDPTAE